MRTTRQVAIYCAINENNRLFYILAKRSGDRGGFWQPFTGGEEDFDNGDLFSTVIRELKEEIGLEIDKGSILDINYGFTFTDKEGINRSETCFGVTIKPEDKKDLKLSYEHSALIFCSEPEYLKSLMKFEENKIGLEKFHQILIDNEK